MTEYHFGGEFLAFIYSGGSSGITVNGHDLSEFSAKLLSDYYLGACELSSDVFQGTSRSTMLLLSQTYGTMEVVLPLEFWGSSRGNTVECWSRFCRAVSGKVELDLGDGFVYACCATNLGQPQWICDGWMSVDVTFRGLRQKPQVTISATSTIGASIQCASTFPRTDCIITIPQAVLGGATQAAVVLGKNKWLLNMTFSNQAELVLDGVNKVFLLNGENVTAQMDWEDFPYLVPGANPIGVYINTIGVTRGIELTYRPTFL